MDLHIKDVFKQYIKKREPIGDAYYTQKITQWWHDHLNQSITSRTLQLAYHNGKLKITVNSAPLRHELFTNRKQLMDRINEFLDADIVHVIEL